MKKTSSDLDTIITKSSEIRILNFGKFPVGPVVRTLLPLQRAQMGSIARGTKSLGAVSMPALFQPHPTPPPQKRKKTTHK